MNAQELIDAAHDPFLPNELWDMVEIPTPPAPAVAAPVLSPALEIVDVPEAPPEPEDITPLIRRRVDRLDLFAVGSALVGVGCILVAMYTNIVEIVWLGSLFSGAALGFVAASIWVSRILKKHRHVKGS